MGIIYLSMCAFQKFDLKPKTFFSFHPLSSTSLTLSESNFFFPKADFYYQKVRSYGYNDCFFRKQIEELECFMDLSSGKVCSVKLNFRWLKKMVLSKKKKRTLKLIFFSPQFHERNFYLYIFEIELLLYLFNIRIIESSLIRSAFLIHFHFLKQDLFRGNGWLTFIFSRFASSID